MRLIDAEKAEQKFVQMAESVNPRYRECILTMALYLRNEDDIPTVDAEPIRHGRWISERRQRVFKCSVCGNYLDFDGVNGGRGSANYCPNCGAKMDEEVNENETN